MSKKIAVKKTASSTTNETDELLSKYAEQYDVPLEKLQEAHANIKETQLKGAKNADKRALVKLLGSLREGRLVDTEPASFLLFGVGSLQDRQEFNLKMVKQFVAEKVPRVFNDLESKGSMMIGVPTFTRRGSNTPEKLDLKVTAYHPSQREQAVKEHGENFILDIDVKVGQTTTPIPCVAIDTLKTFPKSQEENRNFNKPVTHQFSRRYVGIGTRHNVKDEDGDPMYTPIIVTTYGENAQNLLPLHQSIDYDVKVTEITNDKKDVILVAVSLPEFSKPTKVYDKGVAGNLDPSWVVNNEDDVTEMIEVADQWYTAQSGITRGVDYDSIQSIFLNKKAWDPMVKKNKANPPELYTGYFQVAARSNSVIFGDVISGRLIDAESANADLRTTPTLSFQACGDNPLTEELKKGDVIKAIFFFQETNVYDRDAGQRTQELEPQVYLMGWSWEFRAGGESFVAGEEVN